jgi:hypothetical protein
MFCDIEMEFTINNMMDQEKRRILCCLSHKKLVRYLEKHLALKLENLERDQISNSL